MTWAADDPERASRGGWVFNSPEPVFGKNDLRWGHSIIMQPTARAGPMSWHTYSADTLNLVVHYWLCTALEIC